MFYRDPTLVFDLEVGGDQRRDLSSDASAEWLGAFSFIVLYYLDLRKGEGGQINVWAQQKYTHGPTKSQKRKSDTHAHSHNPEKYIHTHILRQLPNTSTSVDNNCKVKPRDMWYKLMPTLITNMINWFKNKTRRYRPQGKEKDLKTHATLKKKQKTKSTVIPNIGGWHAGHRENSMRWLADV